MSQRTTYCLPRAILLLLIFSFVGATPAAELSVAVNSGWNLLGNSTTTAINVRSVLGDRTKVVSVWQWDRTNSAWAFFSPALASDTELSVFALGNGYQVLASIPPGQGFWVNAASSFTLALGERTPYNNAASDFAPGWNLISTSTNATPSAFNQSLGTSPVTSLWGWCNSSSKWYFYAPALEAQGALADYIASRGYRDFASDQKMLGEGVGFWVNMAASTAVPLIWDAGNWNSHSWQ